MDEDDFPIDDENQYMDDYSEECTALTLEKKSSLKETLQIINTKQSYFLFAEQEEIRKFMRQLIFNLIESYKVSQEQAIKMLDESQWSSDLAYLDLHSLSSKAKSENDSDPKQPLDPKQSESCCSICHKELSETEVGFELGCHHTYCEKCLSEYICSSTIESGAKSILITCKFPNCQHLLEQKYFDKFLPSLSEKMTYDSLLFDLFLQSSLSVVKCPNKSCPYYLYSPENGSNIRSVQINLQCKCGQQFCSKCMAGFHLPLSCELMDKWNKMVTDHYHNKVQDVKIQLSNKHCPQCDSAQDRQIGCTDLTCGGFSQVASLQIYSPGQLLRFQSQLGGAAIYFRTLGYSSQLMHLGFGASVQMKCQKCQNNFCNICLAPWSKHEDFQECLQIRHKETTVCPKCGCSFRKNSGIFLANIFRAAAKLPKIQILIFRADAVHHPNIAVCLNDGLVKENSILQLVQSIKLNFYCERSLIYLASSDLVQNWKKSKLNQFDEFMKAHNQISYIDMKKPIELMMDVLAMAYNAIAYSFARAFFLDSEQYDLAIFNLSNLCKKIEAFNCKLNIDYASQFITDIEGYKSVDPVQISSLIAELNSDMNKLIANVNDLPTIFEKECAQLSKENSTKSNDQIKSLIDNKLIKEILQENQNVCILCCQSLYSEFDLSSENEYGICYVCYSQQTQQLKLLKQNNDYKKLMEHERKIMFKQLMFTQDHDLFRGSKPGKYRSANQFVCPKPRGEVGFDEENECDQQSWHQYKEKLEDNVPQKKQKLLVLKSYQDKINYSENL